FGLGLTLAVPVIVQDIDEDSERLPQRRAMFEKRQVLVVGLLAVKSRLAGFIKAIDEREEEKANCLCVVLPFGGPASLEAIGFRKLLALGCAMAAGLWHSVAGPKESPHAHGNVNGNQNQEAQAEEQQQPEQAGAGIVKAREPAE